MKTLGINRKNRKGLFIGYWEDYYSNGQLWKKGNYINGKYGGIWEWYYENGQLMCKGNYINGERDGMWEFYRENGQLMRKGNYINGIMDGIWEDYDMFGVVSDRVFFHDGIKYNHTENVIININLKKNDLI